MKKVVIVLFSFFVILPTFVFAKVGVGVATGKIQVDQPLNLGLIHDLPPLTVINTGDEPSEYKVLIQYRENVPEMRPEADWFAFEPATFYLEPGAVQTVKVKMKLPLTSAKPGDYFCFLQASPIQKVQSGGVQVLELLLQQNFILL